MVAPHEITPHDSNENADSHDDISEDARPEFERLVLSPADSREPNANEVIQQFLLQRSAEYRELFDLRQEGWNNPDGDKHFERQRRIADTPSAKKNTFFYKLMQKIGKELHLATGGFDISTADSAQPAILDLCMAPGGFLDTVLKFNPTARALAFSLPVSSGGYEVLLPAKPNVTVEFRDITMLAADMGVAEIPFERPDVEEFLLHEFIANQQFDLILCDGHVLRTHKNMRSPYRENREASRLTVTQLALGLDHVRPGGTMIVLLHKVEKWKSLSLVYSFAKFSSVNLFKPTAGHTTRSSFYMVASSIQTKHPEALRLIKKWKTEWKVGTFGTDEEYKSTLIENGLDVNELLEEFGAELIRQGRKMWDTQAKALARAPYIKGRGIVAQGSSTSAE